MCVYMGGGEGVEIISAFSKLPNIHVFSDPVLVTLKIIIKKINPLDWCFYV